MSTARFLIGDVFDGLAALKAEGTQVDLVLTSPPFLALRSYLPADHPDKAKEIGSEPSPADFLSTMLAVTEACADVLAPHGSICVELGDSYSGSGGAGGDYADDGWRNGQQKWGGSASRSRASTWSHSDAKWLAAVIDTDGSVQVRKVRNGPEKTPSYLAVVAVSMMERQICDRAAEITGVGETYFDDKRKTYTWAVSAQQARYVLLHIWPFLLIKQKQAKAAIELARHVEESKRRGQYGRVTDDMIRHREMIRDHVKGWNLRGEERGTFDATWEPPTPERMPLGSHAGTGWPLPKSLTFMPQLFGASLAYGRNLLDPERTTDPWRVRNFVAWVRPNPPVGALGDKVRPATSYLTWACKSDKRWFDLDAVRTAYDGPPPSGGTGMKSGQPRGAKGLESNPAGAPPLDWWQISPGGYSGAHYATFPAELCRIPIEASCPRRVCRECGTPSRREVDLAPGCGGLHQASDGGGATVGGHPNGHKSQMGERNATTTGWTSCGCPGTDGIRLDGYHTGPGWRPGIVLDPFAGSGTTLLAATGRGRDAIGIDLDDRNADLARERIGMFLSVEHLSSEAVA